MSTTDNKLFSIVPLNIEVRGEVVASNFAEFKKLVSEGLAKINQDLTTDEHFGQAETDVKTMKDVESVILEAKETALKQAEHLHQVFSDIDQVSEEVRQARLTLERQIKDKKQQLKQQFVDDAIGQINVDRSLAEKTFALNIQNALKGKRTLDSIKKAIDVTVTNINVNIAQTRKVLDDFELYHGKSLTMDRHDLEVKDCAIVASDLQRRIELKKAEDEKREAEAKRKQAEAEAAKAKQEAKEAEAKSDGVPLPPKHQDLPKNNNIEQSDKLWASAAEEWKAFKRKVIEAFNPIKTAKEELEYHVNQERAKAFADALNKAWKDLT